MKKLEFDNWTHFFQYVKHNYLLDIIKNNNTKHFEIQIHNQDKLLLELKQDKLRIVQLRITQFNDLNEVLDLYPTGIIYFRNFDKHDTLNPNEITELKQVYDNITILLNYKNLDFL